MNNLVSHIEALKNHLQASARHYFDDFADEQVQVELSRSSQRINSTLYEFKLTSESMRHNVLVKIPFAVKHTAVSADRESRIDDRPRLSPKPSTQHKCEHEFSTLSAIACHVKDASDARFGAVRILGLLPEQSVLLMERIEARSLSRLLVQASRLFLHRRAATIERACRHAGTWLRFFHALPNLPHTQTRCAARQDFLESTDRFTDYLGQLEDREFFARVKKQVMARAEFILPEYLPLGLAHGDYAPRNVLVNGNARVSIIDTLGRWQAPVFEDLSRFLCALHVSVPQIWLQGCAYSRRVLNELERHFLEGYFTADAIPYEQIRLFQCQALLDRWASFVHSCRCSRGVRQWAKNGRRWWWRRYFSQHLVHTIRQVNLHCDRRTMLENAV